MGTGTQSQRLSSPDLSSTVAVVTGGSRGIGLAIVKALVSRNARVAIVGRSQEHLDRATTAFTPDTVFAVRADVAKADQARKAIDAAADRFGGLDVLVNNAGVGRFVTVADMSADEWQETIDTNLGGVFHSTSAALPHLKRRGGGWVISISSLASKNPFAGGAAYSASKAGLNAFSEALMQEVRYDNIRVSCILPGSVATGFGGRDTGADWKIAPEDVADLVVDLVSFPARSLPSRIELRPSRPKKA